MKPLTFGEQLNLVMTWNWQLRFNQYTENSAFAVKFSPTLHNTQMLLHCVITNPTIKRLMLGRRDASNVEFETIFLDELKKMREELEIEL